MGTTSLSTASPHDGVEGKFKRVEAERKMPMGREHWSVDSVIGKLIRMVTGKKKKPLISPNGYPSLMETGLDVVLL